MDFISNLIQNLGPWLAAINAGILALIAIFALIPGDQPEKFLHSVADFIGKFSAKKE